MAGIIKNQILKHLSRYVKKLSSDRINVSTLKGEGELTDLELDEEVLTELLALPIWMKIKRAHCNRARLLIQWTKLKSIPIRLVLDTIEIEIEACEEFRPVVPTTSPHLTLPTAGKYGFANKVVDGITISVEAVEIRFFSKAFESKVQISRIRVESKSAQWKKVDLTHTRLKDVEKGELLTFKEIEWQTLRLEAQSTKEKHLAPLRLLTNQAKARVVIKKKLSDCSVIGCRLSLILDDLLWVLTDSQILAAAHFMTSLSGLVKQATEMTHAVKAARKLEISPEYRAQQNQATTERLVHSDSSRIFDAFDVKETSYHLICAKIDLHFCDDPGGGRSNHPDLRDGGAGQVQLTQFSVDFYPYHLAKADRRHWFRYSNNDLNHWLKESLATFQKEVLMLFPKSMGSSATNTTEHSVPLKKTSSSGTPDVVSSRLSEQLSKLMSTCLVIKIGDVCIYKVTTSSRETPMSFLSSYLERPKDISAINMEFTWFYYPQQNFSFPLPSPKFFTQVNPLQIHIDVCTILWLNSFLTNLQTSTLPANAQQQNTEYLDIRLELIMPKIVFEEKHRYPSYKERPNALQIQASRIVVSNYRSQQTGTLSQLALAIDEIKKQQGSINSESNIPEIPEKLVKHSQGLDKVRSENDPRNSSPHLTPDMLWTEARDVWYISIDTIWADFVVVDPKQKGENGDTESKRRFRASTVTSQSSETLLLPFVDSVPVTLWLYVKEEPIDSEFSMGQRKDIQAILRTDGMCNVQITHQQYLFLLRTIEAISEISLFLTIDTRKTYIVSRRDDSVELILCVPRIEISFILPHKETLDLPRETSSSILGDIEPQMAEMASLIFDETQKFSDIVSNWSRRIPEEKKGRVVSSSAPESPEKFYSDYPAIESSSVATGDGFKSTSLTHGMKQGLSNLVVSFSKGGGQSTPDSEVTSMWSTDSSENNFIQLDPDTELESPYGHDDVEESVEVAEEVIEDNSQSTGSFSIHNPYGKEDTIEINVLTVTLNNVQVGQRSEGLTSAITLCCKSLSVDECCQVPWKDFQTLFATRSKKWRTSNDRRIFKTEGNNAIMVNFTQNIDEVNLMNSITSEEMTDTLKQMKNSKCPRVNLIDGPSGPESPIRKVITKSTHPHLKANIDLRDGRANEGQFITLHSNILKLLGDFFEDEIPPVVLPMKIYVIGANVEILEEKDPNFPPTKACLQDSIVIARDVNGVFNIGCPCKEKKDLLVRTSCYNGNSDVKNIYLNQTIIELKQKVAELEKDKSTLQFKLEELQRKT